jgi:hypothetical protein
MWHAWEREGLNAGIWLDNLKETNHFKHPSIGGMMLLKA